MTKKTIDARGKVFRDPVHELIRIESGDDFILDLINAPEFQRLRRIRQLGVSSFTYPGAEHTRFAHSIGVFNFAQRILAVLQSRYADDATALKLLKENAKVVKAAALLHDVGHGPFSHMIERAFPAIADHEKKTVSLIRDTGSLPERLKSHGIDPVAVASLIQKTTPHRFLVDIVSSQLDADRMDYILRDALSTGVKYGSFDAEWVLNSMCLGTEAGVAGEAEMGKPENWRLCLEDRRGVYSAEQIVMARMHMSFQVYYHRATRGWEAHMLCLLQLAAKHAKAGELPVGTSPVVEAFLAKEGKLDGDDWLFFDESAMESSLQAWARGEGAVKKLAELSRAFLLREKMFLSANVGKLQFKQILSLTKELNAAGTENIDWLYDDAKFNAYKDFGAGFRGSEKDQKKEAESTSAILISDGNLTSMARPIESTSQVLQALGDNPQGTRESVSRIYARKELFSSEQIGKLLVQLGIKPQ